MDTKSKNPDAEVVIVPLEGPQDVFDLDDGVVDTGYPGPYFFNPFGNPFSGFMTGMDGMFSSTNYSYTCLPVPNKIMW